MQSLKTMSANPQKIKLETYLANTENATKALMSSVKADKEQLEQLATDAKFAQLRARMIQASYEGELIFPEQMPESREELAAKSRVDVTEADAVAAASALTVEYANQTSVDILCGAILQIAKQALSWTFGAKGQVPSGRLISGVPLKCIIWQGRNHAMHFEEAPRPDSTARSRNDQCPDIVDLFDQFQLRWASEFTIPKAGQTMAGELVSALGWTDYSIFHGDMQSFVEVSPADRTIFRALMKRRGTSRPGSSL